MPGKFVTFEGGEGAGKSTQVDLLVRALTRGGIDAIATREPGGSPGAEAIRNLLLGGAPNRWDAVTEVLLHFAARRDHVERVVKPALECDRWVVCDRFSDSTLAYQGYGLGVPRDLVETIRKTVLGAFVPDLTLLLDLPVEAGKKRLEKRGTEGTRYERLPEDFHERVRAGYLEIAARDPKRCAVIDAGGHDAESIHAIVCEVVRQRMAIPLTGAGKGRPPTDNG